MMSAVMRCHPRSTVEDPEKADARRRTEELEQRIARVVQSPAVMTAVEALKAQRVVREAGRN